MMEDNHGSCITKITLVYISGIILFAAITYWMGGRSYASANPTFEQKTENLSARINSLSLSPTAKALACGLLFGDKTALSRRQKQTVREAGMSHIVAVSGMHIGIIYIIIYIILIPLRWMNLLRLHRAGIILTVWLYVLMIGIPLSAVRAALMLSISTVAWMAGRNTSGLSALSSAAAIMLLYDPMQLWDVGFQLSVLATLGIILADSKMNWIYQLFWVTLSAQIATMPVIAYYFHLVPLFGWLQGILVIPLLPFLVYLLIGQIIFPNLEILSYPIEWLTRWVFLIAETTASIENWCLGGKLLWYPSLWETVVLEMLCLLGLFVFSQRGKHSAGSPNILSS